MSVKFFPPHYFAPRYFPDGSNTGAVEYNFSGSGSISVSGSAATSFNSGSIRNNGSSKKRRRKIPAFQPYVPMANFWKFTGSGVVSVSGYAISRKTSSYAFVPTFSVSVAGVGASSFNSPITNQIEREDSEILLLIA